MGFLHGGATLAADLNLLVQVAMGVALLVGMRLARQRRFRAHARCQTAVMALNLAMIALVMAPSFQRQVAVNLRKSTSDLYDGVAAIHAGLGTIAELLGIYVALVATGAAVIPVACRFRNFRAWMRATLAMWWIVIALGIGTYIVWYRTEPASRVATDRVAAQPTVPTDVTVTVQNFAFGPKEITVPVGATVTWTDAGGRHTVQTADGFLKSDTLVAGQSYKKRFDKPGVYDYYCDNHGSKSGTGMTGRVIVR